MAIVLPIINTYSYLKMANTLGSIKRIRCGYCGNENAALGGIWICFHCENVNDNTVLLMKLNNTDLMDTLEKVNGFLASDNYEQALAMYGEMVAKYKDPCMTYNYGLMHLQYSNYEIASIRYDRKGFMEENAMHREKGDALASRAKLVLNRASVECQKKIDTENTEGLWYYTLFIINIKLHRMKTAMRAMDKVKDYSNEYLNSYCRMIFNAETGNYYNVAKSSVELLGKGQFSPNALYYVSWTLFKAGRLKDSLVLITALDKQLQNSSTVALKEEVEKAMVL